MVQRQVLYYSYFAFYIVLVMRDLIFKTISDWRLAWDNVAMIKRERAVSIHCIFKESLLVTRDENRRKKKIHCHKDCLLCFRKPTWIHRSAFELFALLDIAARRREDAIERFRLIARSNILSESNRKKIARGKKFTRRKKSCRFFFGSVKSSPDRFRLSVGDECPTTHLSLP